MSTRQQRNAVTEGTVSRRLKLIYIFIILALLGGGAFLFSDLYHSQKTSRENYTSALRGMEVIGELQYQMQEARRTLLYALGTSDANLQVKYADDSRSADEQVSRLLGQQEGLLDSPARTLARQRLVVNWNAYLKVRDELISSILEGDAKAAIARDQREGIPAFNQVRNQLVAIKQLFHADAERLLRDMDATASRSLLRLGVMLAILLVGATLAFKFVQRNAALKAVQSSEARLRNDLESIAEELFALDAGGRVVTWNAAAEKNWRRTRASVLGRDVLEALPELAGSPLRDALDAALQHGRSAVLENLPLRRHGAENYFQTRVFPIQGGVSVFLNDVTAAWQAERELRASRQKFETLVNSVEGVVWEADPRTNAFTFVSRRAESLLGFPQEQWTRDPAFWAEHLHPDDRKRVAAHHRNEAAPDGNSSREYRMIAADGRTVWVRDYVNTAPDGDATAPLRGILIDITAQKEAEDKLAGLNKQLVTTSRLAGMAEVATGVLHNVGNVLNSVSVSATVVSDRLKQSRVINLRRATAMLREKNGHLAEFLTSDPKGKLLPEYLGTVAEQLATEQAEMLGEVTSLNQNIEHIKEIVAMQQSYATVSGAFEHLTPIELVEDALRMNSAAFERHRVELIRDYATPLPLVNVDRHKVLQILINLIRNAKYALDAGNHTDKRLVVRVERASDGMVAIHVRDNGVGIAPENLARIFNHGFTTKKEGHGFGLHSGANAAREMHGRLSAHSDGPDQGATFTLELPVAETQLERVAA